MKILIIGRGGREHAMAWKCRQSKRVTEVFVAKGNAGMKDVATLVDIDETDVMELLKFALENNIDLTIAGTETPLELGLADVFHQHGLKIFAPSSTAAKIETSKDFAKQLMQRANIPTAAYATFSDFQEASNYVKQKGAPIVIKNDGLAAGKGVVVAMNMEEAIQALEDFLLREKYGMKRVVIEEYLEGEEFTLMCMAHGDQFLALPLSQDHKRAYDNDLGPNTGGMGAYSPVPQIHSLNQAIEQVVKPLLTQMTKEGMPFTGFLYAGLMQTKDGVKVIEFNARFGDPECEVLLPILPFDFIDTIEQLMQNEITETAISFVSKHSLGVVIASKGYPEKPEIGYPIYFHPSDDVLVFHAGTKEQDHNFVSAGGRVAVIVALGENLTEAKEKAYQYIDGMKLTDHFFYRKDIAQKAIKFLTNSTNEHG
jgi:phosphoribosylamine--glycine ligase